MTEIAIAERVRAASEEEKTLNRKEPSAAGAATKIRNVSRKGAKAAKKAYCHFDRREKSFLDPSHSLGITGLARPLAPVRLRRTQGGRIDRRTVVPYNPSWLSESSATKALDAFTKMTT